MSASRREPSGFNPTRKLKETLAWIVLSIAVITIGIFAVQVMIKPSAEKPEPSKETSQDKKETKKEEEKKDEKQEDSSKKKVEGIGKIRVLENNLNMRSTPEVRGNNRIASLPAGTELTVLSETNNWYEVINEDGVKGYVASGSKYVEVIEMNQ